jgi:hypothetical protein
VSRAGSNGRVSKYRSKSSSCAGVNSPRHVTLPPSIKFGDSGILFAVSRLESPMDCAQT